MISHETIPGLCENIPLCLVLWLSFSMSNFGSLDVITMRNLFFVNEKSLSGSQPVTKRIPFSERAKGELGQLAGLDGLALDTGTLYPIGDLCVCLLFLTADSR